MEQAQTTAPKTAKPRAKRGKYPARTEKQKALAAALAQSQGASEAARMLDWPLSTVSLYKKRAAKEPEFGKICDEVREDLGAKWYDLSGEAMQQVAGLLVNKKLNANQLISLASTGFQRAESVFSPREQAQTNVNVQVNVGGEELAARLATLADRLAAAVAEAPAEVQALPAPAAE